MAIPYTIDLRKPSVFTNEFDIQNWFRVHEVSVLDLLPVAC